jgi:FlaA1/EpsC-like NDP-sugar epimerase
MTAFHALVMSGALGILDTLTSGRSPVATAVTFGFVFFAFAAGARYILLQILRTIYRTNENQVPILIYGAGRTGQQLARALKTDEAILPIAFIDDNPGLQSTLVQGLRVYSPVTIPTLVQENAIERVLLAMPSQNRARLAQVTSKLEDMELAVETLPSFAQLAGSATPLVQQLRPASPGKFLGRPALDNEMPGGSENYAGKSILITGAGGSIGSELCRQLLACKPRRMVLMELSELALYTISNELENHAARHEVELIPTLGSVADAPIVRKVLAENETQVVLHAAAYKHVPIVERDPVAGFSNNAMGTHTLANAAAEAGVERFILISTDKAVRPKNMMGASKRLAETIVQDLASRSNPNAGGTIFSMVRFGNVIGSSGSVIPLFQDQINRGGPVTLTHRDVTRYFMTIPEAARLVLVAGTFATGGDVFVLDMGDPIPIYNLARQMIEAAGYTPKDDDTPDGDIEIVLTGLRPGEKLEEELLIGEGQTTTPHPKILQARETHLSEFEVAACVKALRTALAEADENALRDIVARWVEGGERVIRKSQDTPTA